MEYGICGGLIIIYPKPYSMYLRGTIGLKIAGVRFIRLLSCLGVASHVGV